MGVVVMNDCEVLMFNHNKGLTRRAYFLYDGCHYNLCVHEKKGGGKQRVFSPTDEQAY